MTALLLIVSGWPVGRAAVKASAPVTPPVYIPVYNLTDLGTISGDTDSFANAINATGVVTGWSTGGTHMQRAFRYATGTMTPLTQIDTSKEDVGFAINASGVVAGAEETPSPFAPLAAVTWTGTTPTNLDASHPGWAEGINDAGDSTGYINPSAGVFEGFRDHAGTLTALSTGVTTGATTLDPEEGTSINTSGEIVGDGQVSDTGPLRAFLLDATGTTMTNLGVLGGRTADNTVATAINDAGHVAGYQFGTLNHPFFWNGSLHDLGTIAGYPDGSAADINASDWIVGEVDQGNNGPFRAAVWAGGMVADLNTRVKLPAGWTLEYATGINDAGQIVGGALVSGHLRAFLLTPSNVTRIAGATRYDTAAMISAQNYTSPQAKVYIATGQNFADALAGAALAGRDHAPLLLVPTSGALPASVSAELVRIAPTKIIIFGGDFAVSEAMRRAIHGAVPAATIASIAGATRYDTAATISRVDYTTPQATVYVASGANFPDALAGAALAGRDGAPLLLVPPSGALPASVATELGRLAPTAIIIFGGPGAVTDGMLALVAGAAPGATVSRISGTDRYDTAAKIAQHYTNNPQPIVYVATGLNFADALAGAALAGAKGAPLLLVPGSGALPATVSTELGVLNPTSIVMFGGIGAVSTGMEEAVAKY